MTDNLSTEGFASEIQRLREVIPHARNLGAEQTNISIELLARLLAIHDAPIVSAVPAQQGLVLSQQDVEHLLHARRELTRQERSPQRIRDTLASKITAMLSPLLAKKSSMVEPDGGAAGQATKSIS